MLLVSGTTGKQNVHLCWSNLALISSTVWLAKPVCNTPFTNSIYLHFKSSPAGANLFMQNAPYSSLHSVSLHYKIFLMILTGHVEFSQHLLQLSWKPPPELSQKRQNLLFHIPPVYLFCKELFMYYILIPTKLHGRNGDWASVKILQSKRVIRCKCLDPHGYTTL